MQAGFGLSLGISMIEKNTEMQTSQFPKKVEISHVHISGLLASLDGMSALGFSSRFLLSLMDNFLLP
jgi:hypothetical protein